MTSSDPYLLHNAFDDLPEYAVTPSFVRSMARTKQWAAAARRHHARRIVGSDLTSLRVDDADGYRQYRDGKRAPYVAELGRRLDALEKAVAAHTADNHGGGRLDELEREFREHISDGHGAPVHLIGEAVVDAAVEAQHGGERLPVARHLQGVVECWRDGTELCCTVKVPAVDGARWVTATAPVSAYADAVVGGAMDADVDLDDFFAHAPNVACVVGCESLISDVVGLLPSLSASSSASSAYLHGTDVLISCYGGRA